MNQDIDFILDGWDYKPGVVQARLVQARGGRQVIQMRVDLGILQIETTAQVTQGPAQNIVLMEKKEAMLGFITMGVALQGWNGVDWAKGTRYRSMRVIFPMYDTAFQFAAPKRLAIKSLNDFADFLDFF